MEEAHGWRPRRSDFGELVQWDTSEHDWLEGRGQVRYPGLRRRTSACSRRSAVSTWTSSPRRLCQRRVLSSSVAFDIGTGTGVLAAVLARRGIERVVATDLDPRALACARENVRQLGLIERIEVVQADLFPEGRAALVICNPPWIPARPSSPMENGIYDPESRMLRGFLSALPAHLDAGR